MPDVSPFWKLLLPSCTEENSPITLKLSLEFPLHPTNFLLLLLKLSLFFTPRNGSSGTMKGLLSKLGLLSSSGSKALTFLTTRLLTQK